MQNKTVVTAFKGEDHYVPLFRRHAVPVLYNIKESDMNWVDATTCGNGSGPRTMLPVVKEYMLASTDQAARTKRRHTRPPLPAL